MKYLRRESSCRSLCILFKWFLKFVEILFVNEAEGSVEHLVTFYEGDLLKKLMNWR